MARFAMEVNQATENIGARRLATILETVLEELSFEGPEKGPAQRAHRRRRGPPPPGPAGPGPGPQPVHPLRTDGIARPRGARWRALLLAVLAPRPAASAATRCRPCP